mmetsp:Transcript_2004/g.3125  ORF Transcript_2004/g.3125 Transcript_2004/m.3125 type:complete len:777 (+) Transcript_2004:78-2408(+)
MMIMIPLVVLVNLCMMMQTAQGFEDRLFGERDISNPQDLKGHLEALTDPAHHSHRQLNDVCVDGGLTKIYYFEVTIRLEPVNCTEVCPIAEQVLLGHDINLLLLDYGIGAAGADDDAVFLAGVCPQPTSQAVQEMQQKLRRLGFGYVWKGGGGCRGCFGEDGDGRMLLQATVTGSAHEDWFTQTYAPWLEETLETAILQEIFPVHESCLGYSPPVIEVMLDEVSLEQLQLGCDNGQVIDTLQSMSFEDEPLRDRECRRCATLDFSKYKQASGRGVNKINRGDYVKSQWRDEYGVMVTASGGYTPNFQPRIFDANDKSCINEATRDLEFGSPNITCKHDGPRGPPGGPNGSPSGPKGSPSGPKGSPSGPRLRAKPKGKEDKMVNCRAIGNALIIQESNSTCPNSNEFGGIIKFTFDEAVLVSDIGLMDVDEQAQRIRVVYADGVSELFAYPGSGDNSVQRIVINKINVKQVEVILSATGAVTGISFCPECKALRSTRSATQSECYKAEDGMEIKGSKTIVSDDFEDHFDTSKPVRGGWRNAVVDTSDEKKFGKFLGRYGRDMPSPHKEYRVPRDVDRVTFSLDFYEIDLWDNDNVLIFVDGEKITLGPFSSDVDEGTSNGITALGIEWMRESAKKPAHLGFNSNYKDQIHHVVIKVPDTTGLFKDGKLRLTLQAHLTEKLEDQSAGWDNIEVSTRAICTSKEEDKLAKEEEKQLKKQLKEELELVKEAEKELKKKLKEQLMVEDKEEKELEKEAEERLKEALKLQKEAEKRAEEGKD